MATSGMAARVRASTDSETFDLAGQSESAISHTISSAFAEPFALDEMVRITFVVGAGKLGRQRYDDNAAKAVTTALRSVGFEEDHGASCIMECAGTYKLQHDTGKNLKTVVVFPKVTSSGAPQRASATEDVTKGISAVTLDGLGETSPEHICAVSSQAVFANMLKSKCPSWSQKKGCLSVLSSIQERVQMYENKLLKGEPLTDAEQEWYNTISLDEITQKEALVKKEMAAHVEEGRITSKEKSILLTQVSDRIQMLNKEIADAEKEKKSKKVETLSQAKKKAEERKKVIEGIAPQPPHRLKHHAEIAKLRQELKPLLKLEESTKGRLLTLKETTTLVRKDEILDEILQLEDSSRGWFEDDEVFAARVQANRNEQRTSDNKKAVAVKKPATSSGGTISKPKAVGAWVTPGATKKKVSAAVPAKKPTGGIFAAMMDSDSDSD